MEAKFLLLTNIIKLKFIKKNNKHIIFYQNNFTHKISYSYPRYNSFKSKFK